MDGNKRIIFNTFLLSVKLALSVLIGLYVSRQVLLVLGASDFGIFQVVGGLVSLMNILATTMTSASYRYIAIEIGKGEGGSINRVFNTLLVIHIILALFFLLIGETLGVYYVHNVMNIEDCKIPDAIYLLQTSIVAAILSVIATPFQGLIIAKEKFVYTVALEIISLLLKLVLVIMLVNFSGSKLRIYAVIVAATTSILYIGYIIYCTIYETQSIKWHINYAKKDYKEIVSFTGWLFLGAAACLGRIQGVALIINSFFGTVLNSAFGLASTINEYVTNFVRTISQATNPQIMKSYGSGNESRSMELTYAISKFSFLIMLVPFVPMVLCIDEILFLWLKEPPEYTNLFTVLFLINGLIWCLSAGFDAMIQSTGKIKKNQIGYSLINISLLPISFVLYKFGFPCYANMVVMIILSVVTLLFQNVIMQQLTSFEPSLYIKYTIKPSLITLAFALIPMFLLRVAFGDSIIAVISYVFIAVIWTMASVYIVGLSLKEKTAILSYVKSRIRQFKLTVQRLSYR